MSLTETFGADYVNCARDGNVTEYSISKEMKVLRVGQC